MIHTRFALLLLVLAATPAAANELISLDLELRLGQHTVALYRLATPPGAEAQVPLSTEDGQAPQTLTLSATPREGTPGEIDLRATLTREGAAPLQGAGAVVHNVPLLISLSAAANTPHEDAVMRVVAFIEQDSFGDWPAPTAPAEPTETAAASALASEAPAERSAFAPEP